MTETVHEIHMCFLCVRECRAQDAHQKKLIARIDEKLQRRQFDQRSKHQFNLRNNNNGY